jgi:uroporphyrinogen decarboxylase
MCRSEVANFLRCNNSKGLKMTGKERVLRVLKGQRVDRLPVALHNYLMAGRMLNIPFDVYPKSGELLAKAQINAWEMFGHDVLQIESGVTAMAEAIGCEIAYAPDQPPHVKTCIVKHPRDVHKLQIPDPETTFPLNELLKAVRLIKQHIGEKAFLMGRADQGPMALVIAIYGAENLITDIALQQHVEEIHSLIEFCTRCTMRLASALRKAGSDGTCIGGCGISLISPAIFRTFELPYQQMFVRHCQAEGLLAGVHICGHEDPILDDMVSSGADWLELDPLTTPEKAAIATKDHCGVLGMIHPTGAVLNGTPAEVQTECRQRIEQMRGGRFIIGPGCALPADCPPENVTAILQAVKDVSANY